MGLGNLFKVTHYLWQDGDLDHVPLFAALNKLLQGRRLGQGPRAPNSLSSNIFCDFDLKNILYNH